MLSKSRILAVRQCRRRLWLEANRPELRVYSDNTRRRFAQGHRLNQLVHRLYPDGHLIDEDATLADALRMTAGHLARRPKQPLFEATFSKHRVLVRADVFRRVDHGFELIEVKSSTRLKPYHLLDCAVQSWVISEAGYPVAKTVLAHVDTGFTYRGDGVYADLLRPVDVTERIAELCLQVPDWIAEGLDTLSQADEPEIPIGPHCTQPFSCPFLQHCSPPKPEFPVTLLPGGGRIVTQLKAEGIEDVREIPEGRLHKPLQQRVRQTTISGEPYIGAEIGQALLALPYPRFYLDFESVQFVIPRWPATRPYQQLPFQWSCHVQQAAGTLLHEEFLDSSGDPPMRPCAEKLVQVLGDQGPIFCYSRYERTVIHQLAARFPDLATRLRPLAERLFDLLPLVRAHYYHPAMKGSFSIKAVLPTIDPGPGYGGLVDVNDGTAAQLAYEELIDETTPPERREELALQLREYCALDTLAMVRMVAFFEGRGKK
jgi:predicted RecB family nuclease